jgi:acyl-CoA reductase-like NAD-dependent aldehyde dehydrogenase
LALADVLYEAGLPPEMLSVVTGNPSTMGDAMITDPDCDLITFTGLGEGRQIHRRRRPAIRRIVLELGGNDPLIVMEDADLDKAAELAVTGATKNSGQRCTAVKRIPGGEQDRRRVLETGPRQGEEAESRRPDGPVNRRRHRDPRRRGEIVRAPRQRCGRQGAKLLHGNNRQGALYPPTVVDQVPHDCELVREETFGPVIRSSAARTTSRR